MKKVYLLLMTITTVSFSFAQIRTGILVPSQEESYTTPKEQAELDQYMSKKRISIKKEAAVNNKGGVIDGKVRFAAELEGLYSFTASYLNPLFPDSSVFVKFTSSTADPSLHAMGMIYDPTTPLFSFSNVQFSKNDVVNVDSILFQGLYFFANPSHTNDSMIATVVIGDPVNGNDPLTYFGHGPAFTLLASDITQTLFDYQGVKAHGQHNGLGGPITARYGYRFKAADAGAEKEYSIYTPGLQIPAGKILGIWLEYFPTSYNAGDSIDLPSSTGDFNVFRPTVYTNTDANDKTFYSYFATQEDADFSYTHASIFLGTDTRYMPTATTNATADPANPNFVWVSRNINLISLHVRGTSTVGINENLTNNIHLSVYPNPSNGVFNINLNAETTENVNLSVKNIVGQTVLTEKVSISGFTKETISLANQSNGLYFLTIENNNVTKTVKLVKE